jgi:methylglutaconyl-CoA hydratase
MSHSEDRVQLVQDARGVITLTLHRPDRNNAYDGAMLAAAHAALDQVQGLLSHGTPLIGASPSSGATPRVLVIRGAGRHFQAGADLQWLDAISRESPQANLVASEATAELMRRINTLPLPVVALVQGGCFGGGTGLIACCDVVIAADNAQFSIAESRWGMIAGIIIPQLNDAMSIRQVRRYALTGERFDAQTAVRIGLVHEVVPLPELAQAGEGMVQALLQNGPEATAQTKTTVLRSGWAHLPDSDYRRLIDEHAVKRQSAEAAEGLASFREKRAAAWAPTQREGAPTLR